MFTLLSRSLCDTTMNLGNFYHPDASIWVCRLPNGSSRREGGAGEPSCASGMVRFSRLFSGEGLPLARDQTSRLMSHEIQFLVHWLVVQFFHSQPRTWEVVAFTVIFPLLLLL
jgi:hypothetical protein